MIIDCYRTYSSLPRRASVHNPARFGRRMLRSRWVKLALLLANKCILLQWTSALRSISPDATRTPTTMTMITTTATSVPRRPRERWVENTFSKENSLCNRQNWWANFFSSGSLVRHRQWIIAPCKDVFANFFVQKLIENSSKGLFFYLDFTVVFLQVPSRSGSLASSGTTCLTCAWIATRAELYRLPSRLVFFTSSQLFLLPSQASSLSVVYN